MEDQKHLWIVETGTGSRASDVLRSAYGIRRTQGPAANIAVAGLALPPEEARLLAASAGTAGTAAPSPKTLTAKGFVPAKHPLVTILPAGAVPSATDLPPGGSGAFSGVVEGDAVSLAIPVAGGPPLTGTDHSETKPGEGDFASDLSVISAQTVLTVAGPALESLRGAWADPIGAGSLTTALRSAIHSSGLALHADSRPWSIHAPAPRDPQLASTDSPTFSALLASAPAALMRVLVTGEGGESAEEVAATLKSIELSDVAGCAVLQDAADLQEASGSLFTLLLHPGHLLQADSGKLLLAIMSESPVALLRALVDGSAHPVELWWTRALRMALNQQELEVDVFARAYGDERWAAGSWAGIHAYGEEPRRIPKRFLERVG